MDNNLINAYVLIAMQPGNLDNAFKEMSKTENVENTSVVAGEYDMVVRVKVKTLENLYVVTDKIRMIGGVEKTTTHVVEKELAL
jgi:DNA-binding Lrp family transcriptional regulator